MPSRPRSPRRTSVVPVSLVNVRSLSNLRHGSGSAPDPAGSVGRSRPRSRASASWSRIASRCVAVAGLDGHDDLHLVEVETRPATVVLDLEHVQVERREPPR